MRPSSSRVNRKSGPDLRHPFDRAALPSPVTWLPVLQYLTLPALSGTWISSELSVTLEHSEHLPETFSFDLESFLNRASIYGNGSPFKFANKWIVSGHSVPGGRVGTEPGLRSLRKPSRNREREAMTYPV